MAMFGRPLWFGYDATEMNKLAKKKLLGDNEEVYQPGNIHHVFATLSFRLSLDVCLQNPRTLPLVRTAVNSYMRVVISMDQETGVMETITPSEPVMAKAAMGYLCDENKRNWNSSIETLTTLLLGEGLIEKGLKGELYSRFLLILAHDYLWRTFPTAKTCPTAKTFTVEQFLAALYAGTYHRDIPPEILNARMNFNHFVPAGQNLNPRAIPALLRDLFRRSAAMQLAPNQPTYDIMIPIYFGNPEETFDESQCGVIMVQTKNKEAATLPSHIFRETFINPKSKLEQEKRGVKPKKNQDKPLRDTGFFVLDDIGHPILFLLFDLGITTKPKNPVKVSKSSGEDPVIWAIHSRGHRGDVFGCVDEMNCQSSIEGFFLAVKPKGDYLYKLCQRNKIYDKVNENFRYVMNAAVEDGKEKQVAQGSARDMDEDIDMVDA
jgi:hypothetical protein